MYRPVYLAVAGMLLVSALLLPSYAGGNHGEIEFSLEDSPVNGTGDMAALHALGACGGVIFGNKSTGESAGAYIYFHGPRTEGVLEERDGDRITGRKNIVEQDTIVFGIYRIIEFRDVNNNSRLEAQSSGYDYHLLGVDRPLRGLSMNHTDWMVSRDVEIQGDRGIFRINLTALNPKIDLKWNDFSGRMEPVDGSVVADSIKISFVMNISIVSTSQDLPVYSAESLKQTGEREAKGEAVSVSAYMRYSIDNWSYRYDDSKILVQMVTGVYGPDGMVGPHLINITTSSPRYMEIGKDTEIDSLRDIYGKNERVVFGGSTVSQIRGDSVAVLKDFNATGNSSVKNQSYFMRLTGKGSENMPGPQEEGFSVLTFSAYSSANISECGWSAETSYFIPETEERAEATPGWLVSSLLVEAGLISMAAVVLSYRKYRR